MRSPVANEQKSVPALVESHSEQQCTFTSDRVNVVYKRRTGLTSGKCPRPFTNNPDNKRLLLDYPYYHITP